MPGSIEKLLLVVCPIKMLSDFSVQKINLLIVCNLSVTRYTVLSPYVLSEWAKYRIVANVFIKVEKYLIKIVSVA